jgi:hypothetical protein
MKRMLQRTGREECLVVRAQDMQHIDIAKWKKPYVTEQENVCTFISSRGAAEKRLYVHETSISYGGHFKDVSRVWTSISLVHQDPCTRGARRSSDLPSRAQEKVKKPVSQT